MQVYRKWESSSQFPSTLLLGMALDTLCLIRQESTWPVKGCLGLGLRMQQAPRRHWSLQALWEGKLLRLDPEQNKKTSQRPEMGLKAHRC